MTARVSYIPTIASICWFVFDPLEVLLPTEKRLVPRGKGARQKLSPTRECYCMECDRSFGGNECNICSCTCDHSMYGRALGEHEVQEDI